VREIDKLTSLRVAGRGAAAKSAKKRRRSISSPELVKNQVKKLRDGGSPEVAFRVAVKDGR